MKKMNRDNFFTYSNESNYENIYIVTQTKTYPARAIRLYTQNLCPCVYCIYENLEEMYSFARRGL